MAFIISDPNMLQMNYKCVDYFYNKIYSTMVSICIADKIQPIVKHGKTDMG